MFVPFVPILLPRPIPQFSSKPHSLVDGKNFNDSSEDSTDLIGNCDCHSKNLGLFGRIKSGWEWSGNQGQEENERKNEILILFQQKK